MIKTRYLVRYTLNGKAKRAIIESDCAQNAECDLIDDLLDTNPNALNEIDNVEAKEIQ